jgi:hypothetical protein
LLLQKTEVQVELDTLRHPRVEGASISHAVVLTGTWQVRLASKCQVFAILRDPCLRREPVGIRRRI